MAPYHRINIMFPNLSEPRLAGRPRMGQNRGMTLSSDLTLVFDLDGTLVDTAPDLLACLNAVLEGAGLGSPEGPHLRNLVGRGARALIVEGMKTLGHQSPEPALVDRLLDEFLVIYERDIDLHSKPFGGVLPLLDAAQSAGVKLGVCTNKREALSIELLRRLDLAKYFPVVLGADSLPVHKPDPAHLTQVIARLGGNENRSVMVGDSITDIETAKAAGIPVIAVSFGYSLDPIHSLGADVVIDHFDEFLPALRQLFPAA